MHKKGAYNCTSQLLAPRMLETISVMCATKEERLGTVNERSPKKGSSTSKKQTLIEGYGPYVVQRGEKTTILVVGKTV